MILQKIRNKYSQAVISCCNEKCKIHVGDKHNFVMLKGELLDETQSEKMCDCIVFQDNKKIAIIELKSKSLHAGDIIKKFVNSGKKSKSIAGSFDPRGNFELTLILLAKEFKNYFAHDRLRRHKLKIDGKTHHVRFGKCGCKLQDFVR